MSQSSLRNNDGNPFLYLETTNGSTAVGTDASGADDIVKIVTGLTSNIDPTSAAGSIAIETTTPGDIEFRPNGAGQSTFVNGDVEILADAGSAGNLLMQDTAAAGLSGVIEFGGDRFVHNYGTQNTFIGETAGNFSLNVGAARSNTSVGYRSLTAITTGTLNAFVGANCGDVLTTGFQNTAIGNAALGVSVTGVDNTAMGFGALGGLNGSGSNNIAIGSSAGISLTGTDSDNIIIGTNGIIGDNRTLRLGQQAGGDSQNKCFIAGISGASVTAIGSVVINSSGQLGTTPSFPTVWNEITAASAGMAVNNGYIAFRATLVTLTLPAVAAQGSRLEIVGKGTGGFLIAQNAGQTIRFNSLSTTTGVAGSLASTLQYNAVQLICITADTDFIVESSSGNLTVV